jgi:hypothetical protein
MHTYDKLPTVVIKIMLLKIIIMKYKSRFTLNFFNNSPLFILDTRTYSNLMKLYLKHLSAKMKL